MRRTLRQAALLGRTFFGRMLESELMPPGLAPAQLVIWSMAVLMGPGLFMVMVSAPRYGRLQFSPARLEAAIVNDRLALITLTMIGLGFAALVTWEGVFPDRRDARILSPLPVRVASQVLGRLGAVAALFALWTASAVTVPGLLLAAAAGAFIEHPGALVAIASMLATLAAGATFMFFGLLALQCLLLATLGRRTAQRLTVALQLAFTVVMLQMALLIPALGRLLAARGPSGHWAAGLTDWLPSVWFLALHDVLAGGGDAADVQMARWAAGCAAGALCAAIVLYAASYGRLLRQAVETPPDTSSSRRAGWLQRLADRSGTAWLWRRGSAVERAVAGFTLRTLMRSRQHRMLLAVYVAVGATIVLTSVVPAILRGVPVTRPGGALASATAVLVFFTLCGMRALFGIPVEPRAAWAFRVREPIDRQAALNGVRRAMVTAGLAPVVAATVLTLAPLWGLVPALRHACFSLLMGLLLVELLLRSLQQIPFTCTFAPRPGSVKRWPAYVFGFFGYAFVVTALEFGPLQEPGLFAVACAGVCAGIWALARARARALAELPGLLFQADDPTAMFAGFNLSESMAAPKG